MAKMNYMTLQIITIIGILIFQCHAAVIHKQATLQGVGSFWQITDIHWDVRYSLDGDTKNMCHESARSLSPDSTLDQNIPFKNGLAKEVIHENSVNGNERESRLLNTDPKRSLVNNIDKNSKLQDLASDHPELKRDQRQLLNVIGQRGDFESEHNADANSQSTDTLDHTPELSRNDAAGANNNGNYGNYLCDAPWKLVETSLNAMEFLHPNPDFVLWTGDMAPHVSDPEPHFDVIFGTLANVTREMRFKFPPGVAILPVLGNHDAFPKNDYPDCPTEFYRRYLEEGGWREVLTAPQQETFARGGYYSHSPSHGLTVLVLNTNVYYMFNTLGTADPDPCQQLAWLRKQLTAARRSGYKVLLSAHSPPGFFERLPVIPFLNVTYNDAYQDVIARYGDVIHSHVYGHLHTDTFRIFAGDNGTDSIGFLAPSVTPWQPNKAFGGTAINPSLRYYTYDAASVLDYVQYHLNLTQANNVVRSHQTQATTNDERNTHQQTPEGLVKPADHNAGQFTLTEEVVKQPGALHDEVTRIVARDVSHLDNEGGIQIDSEVNPGETVNAVLNHNANDVTGLKSDRSMEPTSDEIPQSSEDWYRSRDLKNVGENLSMKQTKSFGNKKESVPRGPRSVEQTKDSSVRWEIYYRASEAYSLSRLDAENMHQLLHNLETDSQLFDEYYLRNSAGFDNGPCDANCRRNQLCAIKHLRVRELLTCTGYTKTYFANLLSQTFKDVSVDEYAKYFENESNRPENLPGTESSISSNENIDPNPLSPNENIVTSDSDIKVTTESSEDNTITDATLNQHENSVTDHINTEKNPLDNNENNLDQNNNKESDDQKDNMGVNTDVADSSPHDSETPTTSYYDLSIDDVNGSNSSNPHVASDFNGDTGVGPGLSVAVMIGVVGALWLVLAVLFTIVSWRRDRRSRTGRRGGAVVFSNRPSHTDYTPIYGDEH